MRALSDPRPALEFRTWPNAITGSRIVLAPLVLAAQQLATRNGNGIASASELDVVWLVICLVGLVLAEVSDVMDGRVARRMSATSSTGKLLDPFADSVFRQFIFLGFLASGWMPLWMMAIVLARDILVAYDRIFAGLNNVVLAARVSGKIKAVCQGTAQIATVCFYILHALGAGKLLPGGTLPVHAMSYCLLLVATGVTAWSAVDYTAHVLTRLRSQGG